MRSENNCVCIGIKCLFNPANCCVTSRVRPVQLSLKGWLNFDTGASVLLAIFEFDGILVGVCADCYSLTAIWVVGNDGKHMWMDFVRPSFYEFHWNGTKYSSSGCCENNSGSWIDI